MSPIRFEPKPSAANEPDLPARQKKPDAASIRPAVQGESETEAFALVPSDDDAPQPAKKSRRKKSD